MNRRVLQTGQAGIPWLARMGDPPKPPVQWIPYSIPIGRGWLNPVRLVLPQDMTQSEADRICGVIQTLAFPDGGGGDGA
jgi:hypothetical protein